MPWTVTQGGPAAGAASNSVPTSSLGRGSGPAEAGRGRSVPVSGPGKHARHPQCTYCQVLLMMAAHANLWEVLG